VTDDRPRIVLVAGEASGDLHGATLARALRTLAPRARLTGMGGARMADAGVDVVEDLTARAVVGGTEAVSRVPTVWRAWRRLRRLLTEERPAALVLIDFPEFNLRLAPSARRAGVPVVYFVPPQIWAWRAGRMAQIRRRISLVLAVLPFETPLYRDAGVPVEFVGHPVLDALVGAPSREDARAGLGLDRDSLVVGLLPGSRQEEVERVLPLIREAGAAIRTRYPGVRFVLGRAPTVSAETIARRLHGGVNVQVVDDAHAVMRASDLVLVASGTATLEAALLGVPMVVCYRVSKVTEAMVRLLVRVPWISLVNLTLGRAAVPELYQEHATSERLGSEALRLLDDPAARAAQREAFAELAQELGGPGVGRRAAQHVLTVAGVS
jgi:lipid-A-disaccharide synthase